MKCPCDYKGFVTIGWILILMGIVYTQHSPFWICAILPGFILTAVGEHLYYSNKK